MKHLIELTDEQTATLLKVLDEDKQTIEQILMLGVKHANIENRVACGLPTFIAEMCVVEPSAFVPVAKLKQVINDSGSHYYGQKTISMHLQAKGFKPKRITIDGVQVRCWQGLKLKGAEHEQ